MHRVITMAKRYNEQVGNGDFHKKWFRIVSYPLFLMVIFSLLGLFLQNKVIDYLLFTLMTISAITVPLFLLLLLYHYQTPNIPYRLNMFYLFFGFLAAITVIIASILGLKDGVIPFDVEPRLYFPALIETVVNIIYLLAGILLLLFVFIYMHLKHKNNKLK